MLRYALAAVKQLGQHWIKGSAVQRTPQQDFDDKYVTSMEICIDLDVSRSSVLNRRRAGGLPDAIEVRTRDGGLHLLLWCREDIAPHLETWRTQMRKRPA